MHAVSVEWGGHSEHTRFGSLRSRFSIHGRGLGRFLYTHKKTIGALGVYVLHVSYALVLSSFQWCTPKYMRGLISCLAGMKENLLVHGQSQRQSPSRKIICGIGLSILLATRTIIAKFCMIGWVCEELRVNSYSMIHAQLCVGLLGRVPVIFQLLPRSSTLSVCPKMKSRNLMATMLGNG